MSGNKSLLYKVHFLPPHISTIVLFLWGIRIVEHNKAHVDSTRQMIFLGNHRSYLDALISGSVIKNYKKYIGKAEVLKWPVLGFLLEKLYIPVHREDKNHRAWSMEQLYVKAKEGASIVVFPEGTSNNTSALLKHFHDGAFRLAIPTQLPIMVMTIIGAGEVWNRNVFLLKPGVIHVYWSDPIEMTHYTDIDKDMENLKNVVKSEMLIHLKKHYPDGYKVY
jgi:1-acyl-sn-glycerol-3-phosphate acyltransferase